MGGEKGRCVVIEADSNNASSLSGEKGEQPRTLTGTHRRIDRGKRLLLAAEVGVGVLIVVGFLWSARTPRNPNAESVAHEPLPIIATLPDFEFTERSGRRVRKDDFLGHVWVANFIFTNCSGPCPALSLRMRGIDQALAERGGHANVMLVSFSLDPVHDTTDVLREYADRHRANPDRWWFLTGKDQKSTHQLVEKGFLQAVKAATSDSQIVHSTYFVVVDAQARIRAVHDGLDAGCRQSILGYVDRLLQEMNAP
jgi:protein SCO1/2